MSGMCAEKALVQHLCERFHCPNNIHIFIFIDRKTINTQILRSRGFDVHVPDIFFEQIRISG